MRDGNGCWGSLIGARWPQVVPAVIASVEDIYRAEIRHARGHEDVGPVAQRALALFQAEDRQASLFPATTSRDLFERWWAAYPKHRRLEKIKAFAAWSRIEPPFTVSRVEAMIRLLQQQAQLPDWIKEGGAFVPYPARYLVNGRWMDEVVRMASVPSTDVDNAFALAGWLAQKKQQRIP